MNITFLVIATALLLITAMLWLVPKLRHRILYPGWQAFANAITAINITPKGRATRLADNPFTVRYLLAKAGSDASHIDICTASDIPIGVVPDMTPSTDAGGDTSYPLPVNLLGLNEDTERMVASGAIALDKFVVPDAAGKVKLLPTATGTYYIVGKTLTAAAANNDLIEVAPCFPIINRVP